MPIYQYRCGGCNSRWEAIHKVDERHMETCCGEEAIREISIQAKPQIIEGYIEGLGEYITGPKHMRKVMKAKNMEEVGPNESLSAARKWM